MRCRREVPGTKLGTYLALLRTLQMQELAEGHAQPAPETYFQVPGHVGLEVLYVYISARFERLALRRLPCLVPDPSECESRLLPPGGAQRSIPGPGMETFSRSSGSPGGLWSRGGVARRRAAQGLDAPLVLR